jgi:hypothetical protein
MNDDPETLDLSNWDPQPATPDIKSMLSKVFPYREDPKVVQRKARCVPALSRRFDCPNCGIDKNIDPVFSGEEWHYAGQCFQCGQSWANAYRLMVRCEDCGGLTAITGRNPNGRCQCQGEAARPF